MWWRARNAGFDVLWLENRLYVFDETSLRASPTHPLPNPQEGTDKCPSRLGAIIPGSWRGANWYEDI